MKIQKSLIALAIATSAVSAVAQTNGSNSPYSRYGFGLLNDGGQGFSRGMAGVSLGMRNEKELNVNNPASYALINAETFLFDIGATLQTGQFKANGSTATAKNTAIDYITMGFRASKNLGVSLGLVPFSTIGYKLNNSSVVNYSGSAVTQTEAYTGEGGLRTAYVGLGWAPLRNLSVGMNLGYLWGTQTHTVAVSFSDATIATQRRVYDADVRTYKLDFGLQYIQPIDKKNTVTLGLTYGLGHDIDSKASYYSQTILSNALTGADTLTTRNAFALPHSFGVGLVWQYGKKWRVGADYTLQKWSNVRYPSLSYSGGAYIYQATTDQFSNRSKVSLGAEYVPNAEGLKRSQRIRYRLGASYTDSYTKVDGVDGPRSYQVTAGVGLPIMNMHNNRSVLNLSVGYERVAPRFAGQVAENYFRLGIGITFNENWFAKWRVE